MTYLLIIAQVADSSDPDERNFGHERVLENILKNYRDAQFLVRPAQTTAAQNIDKSVLPVISNDGTVIWVPLAEFTTTCSPDDEDDSWECNIKIGSWAHTAAQISHHFFNNNTLVDLTFYQPKLNGYDVEAIPGEIVDAHYDCCTAAYQYAVFKLRLRFIEGGVASGFSPLLHSTASLLLGYSLYAGV
ncbi:hypothetical protein LSH36_350g04053 [Paralvinella palmiformis]|uniref:Neurotransmitter-gated ion-channel ligand-binding domain-containing protein n=1 Tax=Paralvinella palmiformis TaxID=53620 RepID=A0AAD9N1B4_9ANNE|nr:hypothetical protein LSH36_350g04053 [Paralvinella palmiformis]